MNSSSNHRPSKSAEGADFQLSRKARIWICGVLCLLILAFLPCHGLAQHTSSSHGEEKVRSVDSLKCLKDFFSHSHVGGHVRNYFMATLNEGSYQDYWANAIGGSLHYRTANFRGFEVGLAGAFAYNIASSDLTIRDSVAGKHSKYELQLFDLEDPDNKHDLDRMEELYLKYKHKGFAVKVGKMQVHTPLVNEQDTRMKAYVVKGFWTYWDRPEKWHFSLGWLWGASPRSTVHWYRMEEAIGIYNNGYTTDGQQATYRDHIRTAGIGIAGAQVKLSSRLELEVWDYFLENSANTVFLQVDYSYPLSKGSLVLGGQYLRQDPVNQGGHPDPDKTYFQPDHRVNLGVTRLGWKNRSWEASLNYLYNGHQGRFIFPRELGREQFYTTIGRGRTEGMGGVQAFIVKVAWNPETFPQLKAALETGTTRTPGFANFNLNKYGIVSYNQLNADLRYQPLKYYEGLSIRLLYVLKQNLKNCLHGPETVFNKSNYHHFNLITNIWF